MSLFGRNYSPGVLDGARVLWTGWRILPGDDGGENGVYVAQSEIQGQALQGQPSQESPATLAACKETHMIEEGLSMCISC